MHLPASLACAKEWLSEQHGSAPCGQERPSWPPLWWQGTPRHYLSSHCPPTPQPPRSQHRHLWLQLRPSRKAMHSGQAVAGPALSDADSLGCQGQPKNYTPSHRHHLSKLTAAPQKPGPWEFSSWLLPLHGKREQPAAHLAWVSSASPLEA